MFKNLLHFFILFSVLFSNAQESYYSDVDLNLTGLTLKNALATKIINTHTNFLDYTPDVWNASMETDVNPNNASEVLLIYGYTATGQNSLTRGINNNGGGTGQWNREHTFANSLGQPDLDQGGTNGTVYSDAHNLRPCDTQVNSARSNKRFATGSGTASGDSNGGWYPGDDWRGDVARIIMYMYLRYGDQCKPTFVGIGSNSATPDDMIDLFLEWNAADPVSDVEKQRNPYHEDTTNNSYAQGNRNPFIDNPRLATRIWGGPEAEDLWGIYTNNDTEAPSIPTNLMVSNETTSTLDLSWTASTDNTAVTSYDVFVDGNLRSSVTSTSLTLFNLNSNTTYSLTVLARDAADNASAQSVAINGTTLIDNEAPTVPINVAVSNETNSSFKVSWTESMDNTLVDSYDIFLDGNLHGNTILVEYTATGLTASTTYAVTVLAKDAVGNESAQSAPVNGTTTDGSGSTSTELFFSEYVEGSSNNKALEITNITGASVDLSEYSIQRNGNGGSNWENELSLSGTLANNDVFVIVNGSAAGNTDGGNDLIAVADLIHPNNSSTNNGAPINFNGNDPVGLFKNGVLIDIIGEFGNSTTFAANVTLRRKQAVVNPNTTYTVSEWDEFPQNTVDNIGILNSGTLSIEDFYFNKENVKIFPNPNNTGLLFINTNKEIITTIYNVLGRELLKTNTKQIDIRNLNSGIYLLQIKNKEGATVTKKLIKQ